MQKKTITRAPVARRKRRSQAEITDLIIQAAAEEFKKSGFGGATTAAIAQRADVTEAQLFRYFGSKVELFREAIFKPLNQHFLEFNQQHMSASVDDNVRASARLYIAELQRFIGDHSAMFLSLVVAEAYASTNTKGVSEIEGLHTYFNRGAELMSSRVDKNPKVDPQLMVRVSFAAVLASVMFKDWIFPQGLASDKDISSAIIDFVIDGINANSDPGLSRK